MERKQVLSRLFRGNTQTLKQLHREHYLLNLHLRRLVDNAARPLFIILFRDLYRVVNKIFSENHNKTAGKKHSCFDLYFMFFEVSGME